MEYTQVSDLELEISRVTLGTWAIGGWQWGGTDEQESIDTILKALNMGVTTVDTAPIYGFGKSEEIVGKAVKEFGNREEVQIATKLGLEWDEDENVVRNSSICSTEKLEAPIALIFPLSSSCSMVDAVS